MLHLRLVTDAEGGGWGLALAALHTQPCTVLERRRHVQPAIALMRTHASLWSSMLSECPAKPFDTACLRHSMHHSHLQTASSSSPGWTLLYCRRHRTWGGPCVAVGVDRPPGSGRRATRSRAVLPTPLLPRTVACSASTTAADAATAVTVSGAVLISWGCVCSSGSCRLSALLPAGCLVRYTAGAAARASKFATADSRAQSQSVAPLVAASCASAAASSAASSSRGLCSPPAEAPASLLPYLLEKGRFSDVLPAVQQACVSQDQQQSRFSFLDTPTRPSSLNGQPWGCKSIWCGEWCRLSLRMLSSHTEAGAHPRFPTKSVRMMWSTTPVHCRAASAQVPPAYTCSSLIHPQAVNCPPSLELVRFDGAPTRCSSACVHMWCACNLWSAACRTVSPHSHNV